MNSHLKDQNIITGDAIDDVNEELEKEARAERFEMTEKIVKAVEVYCREITMKDLSADDNCKLLIAKVKRIVEEK